MIAAVGLSATTCVLIAASLIALLLVLIDIKRSKRQTSLSEIVEEGIEEYGVEAPGPKPWPIIGSLDVLGRYDVPYKAFAELAKEYNSQVIKLTLGSVKCVVVNGLDNIRDVLYTKGMHFDSRPNFTRYHLLFAGNKDNSLAFSDWSELQKTRREMLRIHTFPRAFTTKYNQLSQIISKEMSSFVIDLQGPKALNTKSLILQTCANVFTSYFCSRRFSLDDTDFRDMVGNFDKVFWEVNQGYAADFMPFLMPLHALNMRRMSHWSEMIREFVEKRLIENRLNSWTEFIKEEDYVDCLINHVKSGGEPEMTWDTALFALEDIIGGHSAIGNFLMRIFGFLATRENVQATAQREIDGVQGSGQVVGLEQRRNMPYTEAIMLEAIRLIASPIVPHVANRDSSVAGYKIEKDTFIFLNNYDLNMSEDLWTSPEAFMPERFIKDGAIVKPEHFLPFGGGRRSCMGYKLVQYLTFTVVATVLKNFTIQPVGKETYQNPVGSLALPEKTPGFRFEKR